MDNSSSSSSSSKSSSDQSNPTLPDEVLRDCFARVPISYHPIVSQVSKEMNKFVVSEEVYETRSRISHSESLLYVSLGSITEDLSVWYILTKKPHKNDYFLRKLPSFPSIRNTNNVLVAARSKIYSLGGNNGDNYTTDVFSIDCTPSSYQTASLSNMKEVRYCPYTAVIDDTLYVIGGSDDSRAWVESLNLKSGSKSEWKHVPCVLNFSSVRFGNTVVVMNRKIYFLNDVDCYVYDPKEDRLEIEESLGPRHYRISCVVKERLYTFDGQKIDVYDPKEKVWRELNGLENLLELKYAWITEMVSYNGGLVIIHNAVPEEIWCIEIALERRGAETWGKIVTSNRVLHGLSNSTEIKHCLVLEI